MAKMRSLFESVLLGPLVLRNRVFMAPLTRNRANADGVPSELAVQYYAQRASAGLIITEATQISPMGKATSTLREFIHLSRLLLGPALWTRYMKIAGEYFFSSACQLDFSFRLIAESCAARSTLSDPGEQPDIYRDGSGASFGACGIDTSRHQKNAT